MNNHQILEDSIFKIGEVVSVDGRKIKIKVNKSKNNSHIMYKGALLKNTSVGSYVKIIKGYTKIIGKVEGEYVDEDKKYISKEYSKEADKIDRTLLVSLLGFFDGEKFKRGIKELPLVFNECFLLDAEEFEQVHDFINKDDIPLEIGVLSLEKGQKIQIGVNSLFASHIGIFGNTGSGKSYTLAKIYELLFLKFIDNKKFTKLSKFYFFDFNGEYLDSEKPKEDSVIVDIKYKNVYNLSTRETHDKFPVSKDEIHDVNFWSIYLSATEKTQAPFLKRAIENEFYISKFNIQETIIDAIKHLLKLMIEKHSDKGDILSFLREIEKAVKSKINNINEVIAYFQQSLFWHGNDNNNFYIRTQSGNVYESNQQFYTTIFSIFSDTSIQDLSDFEKIRLQIVCQYYDELSKDYLNPEHVSPIIKRLKKIEDIDKVLKIDNTSNAKNINVISLKNVNTEMKKILPLLICKQIYDQQKQLHNKSSYLNIIVDEAHNVLSHNSNRESETWKDYRLETFEEIIKEGRKFGVFLTIASQRPSDISSTIISQLHNYFLHRLINNKDIEAVEKTISYLDKVSFEALPILPTGSCIFAGLAAQVPVMIDIGEIGKGHEPKSDTIKLVENWN